MQNEPDQLHLESGRAPAGYRMSGRTKILLSVAVAAMAGTGLFWRATRDSGPPSILTEMQQRNVADYRARLGPDLKKAGPLIGTQGWVNSATKWDNPVIPVCWERLDPRYASERAWVVDSLTATWEANSAVNFIEFDACAPDDPGIHIDLTDGSSLTHGLGNQLNGQRAALLLNFSYALWRPECRPASIRQSCIRFHAVHEFGHALGFVHEHNRHDGPGICDKELPSNDGDRILTPWDAKSVMNYCDSTQILHSGRLSNGDRIAVALFYGPKAG